MKLKRRELLLSGAAIAAPAQTPQAAPPPPIEQARNAMKANRDAIAKVKLPMDTEPAFVFKV